MGVSRTWWEGNRSLRDLPKQWRNTRTKKALPFSGGDLIAGFGENLGGWKSGELFEFIEVGQKAALWRACLPLQGSETSQLLLSGIIIIFVVLLHLLSRTFSSKLRWDIIYYYCDTNSVLTIMARAMRRISQHNVVDVGSYQSASFGTGIPYWYGSHGNSSTDVWLHGDCASSTPQRQPYSRLREVRKGWK